MLTRNEGIVIVTTGFLLYVLVVYENSNRCIVRASPSAIWTLHYMTKW